MVARLGVWEHGVDSLGKTLAGGCRGRSRAIGGQPGGMAPCNSLSNKRATPPEPLAVAMANQSHGTSSSRGTGTEGTFWPLRRPHWLWHEIAF